MTSRNTKTNARELQQLIEAGRTAEAIKLCQRLSRGAVGGGYYAFWLQRLQRLQQPAAYAATGFVQEEPKLVSGADWDDIDAAFAAHPYRIPIPSPVGADPAAQRAALVAALPFKGAIYLPTEKIPVSEQVSGLRRVEALLAPANLEASRLRFAALRSAIGRSGCRRVFVIGNGPSLKRTDLALLKDEVTIGFNGIFLHEDFTPTIYVVEDHLVAEDRVAEIHAYRCPVKIFPSYLGYCIQPQGNTIYLNHRPRISYPVDTDFSADAGRLTYTGGTVTYTGLQIAASLGVEEIILVGVDASYKMLDVDRSETYGTGVLTSKEDDRNHFDPRYFGKGYRWHDPNVHTMLQAYRKAREYGRDANVSIRNAGLGGQLEVFPRVDYYKLFLSSRVWPRLAVLDFTPCTRLCATGVLKRNLLSGWEKSSQLHLYADDQKRIIAFQSVPHDLYASGADEGSVWPAFRSLVEYDPEVLYLRPTADRPALTIVQVVAAAVLGRPWVVHYMDDWLARIAESPAPVFSTAYHEIMDWLFMNAEHVMAICTKMADHLVSEYGLPRSRVSVVHNFLQKVSHAERRKEKSDQRVIRYFGGIEPDMGLATLLDVARQVENMHVDSAHGSVRLEIRTTAHGIKRHGAAFAGFSKTMLASQLGDDADYLASLSDADVNLICYNFDDASVRYVRHSLANKLPDLISAGAPFIAIGHHEIATIGLLHDVRYPLLATTPRFDLAALLDRAFEPSEKDRQAQRDSLALLQEEFADESNRLKFHSLLRASAQSSPHRLSPFPLRLSDFLLDIVPGSQLGGLADLDILIRLPQLSAGLLSNALHLVRSHGRQWSVRTEVPELSAKFKTVDALQSASEDLKARAVAALICGLGLDRYDALNAVTREWIKVAYPIRRRP